MSMAADETNKDAGIMSTCVDLSVQTLGQPNPAQTHCELWVFEKKSTDDNHFGQYLGQTDPQTGKLTGALWTSELATSREFYRSRSWCAVPVYAVNAEERVRAECDVNQGTPYPSVWTLFDYPWSVWPLRSLSGLFKSDGVHASAHCAALTTRILRHALPEMKIRHNSHWYGPSSLFLELSTPHQMRRALHLQRPPSVVRSQAEDEEDDALLRVLLEQSDEVVAAMTAADSRRAVSIAAINVLKAGSGGERENVDDVDQTLFLKAQRDYAQAMFRHTWVGRVGRHTSEVEAEEEAKREAAEEAEVREAEEAETQAVAASAAAEVKAEAGAAREAEEAAQAADDAALPAAIAAATARFQKFQAV